MRILLITLCFVCLVACGKDSSTTPGPAKDLGMSDVAQADVTDSTPDVGSQDTSADARRPDLNVTTCAPMTDGELGGVQISEFLFVVHSGLLNNSNGQVANTSNIFIFGPDIDGAFWIFGSGYGTFELEAETYRRGDVSEARPVEEDVRDVHTILTGCLGATPGVDQINFLVPHAHLDHVNSEFFTELQKLGYTADRLAIWVHENDNRAATCNSPCCRQVPCNSESPSFGVPFDPPWDDAFVQRFRVIGARDDTCGDKVMDIDVGDGGVWEVIYSPGHTAGSVNLINPQQGILITGSDALAFECRAPTGLTWWHVHGTQPRAN